MSPLFAKKALLDTAESATVRRVAHPALQPSTAFLNALAMLLALLHAVLAVTATAEKSMTSDEIAHLTAGHSYNTRNDYRLHPENGNLPQRLAALPMSLAGLELPSVDRDDWNTADIWNYGHAFFYGQGRPVEWWLLLGRSMIALLSAATGLLIFYWSRALFGWTGAFVSLGLFVFSPTFLAHGALATSDVTMAFFFLASVGAWWRHLWQPGPGWCGLSAIAAGLAFVAKYSAVLLIPMLALIGIVWMAVAARSVGWRAPMRRLARSTAIHVATAVGIIWLFYGFRFSGFAPEFARNATFNHGWGWLLTGMGAKAELLWWLRELRVLPEAWLHGFAFVLQFAQARGAFLSGDYSVTGWPTFFPFAFAVKTTLPLLALLAVGLGAAAIRVRKKWTTEGLAAATAALLPLVPLAALFGVYWVSSITSHLNIGHRHILPTYPVLFILAGSLARYCDLRRPLAVAALGALVAWHGAESFRIRPHYLAYFNQLVGGPANGWRHLVDSSLDWGQDLPGLKRWLDEHGRGEKVFLAYFGTGSPRHEGIDATVIAALPRVGPPRPWRPLQRGLYAVSATMLQQVYANYRGPWTAEWEKQFQELHALLPAFLEFHDNPARRAELVRATSAESWEAGWKRYEQLRLARLCYYLRVRAPDTVIGHSVFVYRLNGDEVASATAGSITQWSALIEQAASRPRE